MIRAVVNVVTEFDKESNLEINDFINNVKESFNNVQIISIESLPKEYSKYYSYEYRVKFIHDLFIII